MILPNKGTVGISENESLQSVIFHRVVSALCRILLCTELQRQLFLDNIGGEEDGPTHKKNGP